ncbi:MAG TPA: maleylacetoacetate isomerase [Polyangiaceae bacterium]|nr:maleylacetoacetate isomerase [Polyangiaceae bacterium]
MISLYSYFRSSCAWRVRIALALKGLSFELFPVHLVRDGGEQHRPEFHKQNPLEQVPVLEVNLGSTLFRLTQSMAILEYLEELYPNPALLPEGAEQRARVRQLSEIVNSGIQPLQNLRLQQEVRAHGIDPAPLVQGFIQRGLEALEHIARGSASRFLVGNQVTFADVFLVPQLGAARRMNVNVEAYPLLRRIERECEALEPFQVAHPERQPDYEP